MESIIEEMFERLLSRSCTPALVRAAERDPGDAQLASFWEELDGAGFADALVDEQHGGIGLSLRDALPLILKTGEHAVPVPIAETMIARAMLRAAGLAPPAGSIILATGLPSGVDGLETAELPHARTAAYVLADSGTALELFAIADATLTSPLSAFSLSAGLKLRPRTALLSLPLPEVPLREVAALLHAAKLAGAMRRMLDMTVDYANTRVQFGRPIGKLQAIQQQISVMAEHVTAALVAVELAFASGKLLPDPLVAAVAKERTSAAAQIVGPIAHAVHGAIGISAEHDLQLYARRLHEWRLAEGSESFWAIRIGRSLMAAGSVTSVEFMRARLAS